MIVSESDDCLSVSDHGLKPWADTDTILYHILLLTPNDLLLIYNTETLKLIHVTGLIAFIQAMSRRIIADNKTTCISFATQRSLSDVIICYISDNQLELKQGSDMH